MRQLADAVQGGEPNVESIIGYADVLSIPIQCYSDALSKDESYNEYLHDTVINNIFLLKARRFMLVLTIVEAGKLKKLECISRTKFAVLSVAMQSV